MTWSLDDSIGRVSLCRNVWTSSRIRALDLRSHHCVSSQRAAVRDCVAFACLTDLTDRRLERDSVRNIRCNDYPRSNDVQARSLDLPVSSSVVVVDEGHRLFARRTKTGHVNRRLGVALTLMVCSCCSRLPSAFIIDDLKTTKNSEEELERNLINVLNATQ